MKVIKPYDSPKWKKKEKKRYLQRAKKHAYPSFKELIKGKAMFDPTKKWNIVNKPTYAYVTD